ncbi:MAG: lysylphosphatidylglycerol synthase domain-containing protein [Crocinitomicaceae bacterium]
MIKIKEQKRTVKLIFGLALLFFIGWKVFSTLHAEEKFPGDIAELSLHPQARLLFVGAFVLMPINWLIESLKWHLLVKIIRPQPFLLSVSSVLAGISTSLLTPNRVGNFIGRTVSMEKELRTKAVIATIHSNIAQFLASVLFGFLGLMLVGFDQTLIGEGALRFSAFFIFTFALIIYFFPKIIDVNPLSRMYSEQMKNGLNLIQKSTVRLKFTVLILSILRYTVFLVQFYLLLLAFGTFPNPLVLIPAIALVYLVTTMIPSFLFGKLFVREATALFILGAFGVGTAVILATVFILWILNLALPALIGAIILMRTK